MKNNGRFSLKNNQDNNFHIKVNRNQNNYNNGKINQNSSANNGSNFTFKDKKIPKLKREEYLIKKMNKNKLQSLHSSNNLSSIINKRKTNKNNKSEKNFLKYKTEHDIIDTLNTIRNNHRKKLNNSIKINKFNTNIPNLNSNTNRNKNNIKDYKAKSKHNTINNKNKLRNALFKTGSYNNGFQKSLKNFEIKNYNINTNNNNNILIDDTTSNDTELMAENERLKEADLLVYNSEVQYPVKNFISNLDLSNSNFNNSNSNINNALKTLDITDNSNYKSIPLFESCHNLVDSIRHSTGSGRLRGINLKNYNDLEEVKVSNSFLSPLQSRILSNVRKNIKNSYKKNLNKSDNSSIKYNCKFMNIKDDRFCPVYLNYSNERINNNDNDRIKRKIKEQLNNNDNSKSCHQFYRKQSFSKDKYDQGNLNSNYHSIKINKDIDNGISPSKEKTLFMKYLNNNKNSYDIYNNTNNIFLEKKDDNNFYNNINNYKYYNRIRNKRINNQLKLISIFCDSVEKFLILILKYYYDYFISQLRNYIKSKSSQTNDNTPVNNNLLVKKLLKNNPKKLFCKEKMHTCLNLSNYKRYETDKRINNLNLLSRNDNSSNKIYKKKSNSIKKSIHLLLAKNRDKMLKNRIKKKKNLSFNKVYIPKHKKQQCNKYKSLKINTTSFTNNINVHITSNEDMNNKSINNTINNTQNSINIHTQNSKVTNKRYCKTINGAESIIRKINHISALKRKYINNNISTNNNSNNSNININHSISLTAGNISNNTINNKLENENIDNNKKIQITVNNIYSKPLFKNIRNKLIDNEKNKKKMNNYNTDKKNNNNKKIINELNNNNDNNKKEKEKEKDTLNTNTKAEKIINKENKNLLNNKVITKKKANYSNNIKNIKEKSIKIIRKSEKENMIQDITIHFNRNIIQELDLNKKNNDNDKINNDIKNNDIKNEINNNVMDKDLNNENNKKNIIDNLSEKDNKNVNKQSNNIIRSIIVKDLSSKDKTLNVFIKYYECTFPKTSKNNNEKNNTDNKQGFKHSLSVVSNESITLINENNSSNRNNSRYLQQILSSIIEEDEKSKVNPSINNSNSDMSDEDSEKNDTNNLNTKTNNNSDNKNSNNLFTNNIVTYLTNILQNYYDDNRRMILYLFMRNLKRIQNKLYLQNTIIQYNSLTKTGMKENICTTNDTYKNNDNNYNYNDNNTEKQIIKSNGGNEIEINDSNNGGIGGKNHSSKDLYYYSSYNDSLLNDNKIKKNILIGSLLFKDFEIKDDEYDIINIRPKKCYSSNSINEMKNNGSEKNLFNLKNDLKDIIINIDNKKSLQNYFKLWKIVLDNNKNLNQNENKNLDNGMNISEINNTNNTKGYLAEGIIEVNTEDYKNNNEVKFLDNGIDIEYDNILIKNTEINREIALNKKKDDDIEKNINKLRYSLIKFVIKHNLLNK